MRISILVNAARPIWVRRTNATATKAIASVVLISALCGLLVVGAFVPYVEGAQKPITIQLAHPFVAPFDKIFNELASGFVKAHKDIKLETVFLGRAMPGEYYDKVLVLAASGLAPDIVWGPPGYLETLYEKGLLVPVTDFIKASGNKYFPSLVNEFRYGDEILGAPFEGGCIVLWYIPDHFDVAGLPSPFDYARQGNWTWDTFRSVLRPLAIDKNGDGVFERVGWTVDQDSWKLLPWFWQAGAEEFDKDFTKSGWDSPEAIGAMQYLWNLVWKEKIAALTPPAGGSLGGNQAMFADGSYAEGRYAQTMKPRWHAAPLPVGRKRATKSLGKGLGILKSSPERERAAWKVIEWLTADEQFIPGWVNRTGYLPVTTTAPQDEKFIQYVKDHKDLLVAIQELQYARNTSLTPGLIGSPPPIDETLRAILRGEKPAETALRQYAAVVNNWISTQKAEKKK